MVRACPAAVLSEPCFRANTAGIGDKMLSVLRVRMRLTVHRRVGTPRVRAAGTGRVRVCIGHRHRHGARSASARESDMGYGLGACMGSRRGALSGPVAFPKMLPKRAKRGNARRVRRAPPARICVDSPPRHPTGVSHRGCWLSIRDKITRPRCPGAFLCIPEPTMGRWWRGVDSTEETGANFLDDPLG